MVRLFPVHSESGFDPDAFPRSVVLMLRLHASAQSGTRSRKRSPRLNAMEGSLPVPRPQLRRTGRFGWWRASSGNLALPVWNIPRLSNQEGGRRWRMRNSWCDDAPCKGEHSGHDGLRFSKEGCKPKVVARLQQTPPVYNCCSHNFNYNDMTLYNTSQAKQNTGARPYKQIRKMHRVGVPVSVTECPCVHRECHRTGRVALL